jgi:branched-subunit amino acid ABC-type transport system permease component
MTVEYAVRVNTKRIFSELVELGERECHVGIYPEMAIRTAFGIGSAAAGIAGILISLETNIEPTLGFSAILKGIIASIIGGIGSIPGAMLGGIFLGIVENLGIWKIQADGKTRSLSPSSSFSCCFGSAEYST